MDLQSDSGETRSNGGIPKTLGADVKVIPPKKW
jgi:hypothetical protein